jgi:hypothetical protein
MVDEHGSPGRFQPLNKKLTLEVSKHRKLPATKCPKGENPKNSRKKHNYFHSICSEWFGGGYPW